MKSRVIIQLLLIAAVLGVLAIASVPALAAPPAGKPIAFRGHVKSTLYFDRYYNINLKVCADNLPGNTVYVYMYRDRVGRLPERSWWHTKKATNTCVTFYNLDGLGPTFSGVWYQTAAGLNGLVATDDIDPPCYSRWDGLLLCDKARH